MHVPYTDIGYKLHVMKLKPGFDCKSYYLRFLSVFLGRPMILLKKVPNRIDTIF